MVGSQATDMGPLTYGTWRNTYDDAGGYTETTNTDFADPFYFNVPVFHAQMTQREVQYQTLEYNRRQHAQRIILARYNYTTVIQPAHSIPDWDSSSGSESDDDLDEPTRPWVCPPCPRWNEITQYLFNNRGPLDLALDTMDFDMPEQNLYKYILDRGIPGGLTPREFRNFLINAHSRGVLFE